MCAESRGTDPQPIARCRGFKARRHSNVAALLSILLAETTGFEPVGAFTPRHFSKVRR